MSHYWKSHVAAHFVHSPHLFTFKGAFNYDYALSAYHVTNCRIGVKSHCRCMQLFTLRGAFNYDYVLSAYHVTMFSLTSISEKVIRRWALSVYTHFFLLSQHVSFFTTFCFQFPGCLLDFLVNHFHSNGLSHTY